MIDREHIVAAVVVAAGGRLTGRVRLQKAIYLLEQLGLNTNFEFEYHHYGPFSRDLDNAVADAKAFHLIEEQFERRQSDGATYSIFKLKDGEEPKPEVYGKLGAIRVGELARLFAETNVTVLELAATVDWLWRVERCPDWKAEITKRKGLQVQGGTRQSNCWGNLVWRRPRFQSRRDLQGHRGGTAPKIPSLLL